MTGMTGASEAPTGGSPNSYGSAYWQREQRLGGWAARKQYSLYIIQGAR